MERFHLREPWGSAARRHRRVHGVREVVRLPTIHNDPWRKSVGGMRVTGWLAACARFRQARPLSARFGPARRLGLRLPPVNGQGMSVAAQEACALSSLLESRQESVDPLAGLAESFFVEIQPLLETPWSVAMSDLVYPQTRGERPSDFERKLQYTRALMRLAAENPETDRILVRSALTPQAAERAERAPACQPVQAVMATTQAARPAFRPGESALAGSISSEQTMKRSRPSEATWSESHGC